VRIWMWMWTCGVYVVMILGVDVCVWLSLFVQKIAPGSTVLIFFSTLVLSFVRDGRGRCMAVKLVLWSSILLSPTGRQARQLFLLFRQVDAAGFAQSLADKVRRCFE
jgi:hypothetical protein